MVTTLIKLKNTQFKNYARKSTAILVGTIVLYLYVIMGLIGIYAMAFLAPNLSEAELPVYRLVAILAPTVLALILVLVGSFSTTGGSGLTPSAFRLLVTPSHKFARQIMIAEFVGIRGIFVSLSMLAIVIVGLDFPILALSYLIGSILFVIAFQYCSKIFMILMGSSETDSDKKNKKQILVFAFLAIPYFYFVFGGFKGTSIAFLITLLQVIQWVPVVSSLAFPFALFEGDYTSFLIQLAIALVSLILLDFIYCKMFMNTLDEKVVSPAKAKRKEKSKKEVSVDINRITKYYSVAKKFGFSDEKAAMLSRVTIYWKKDPRYNGSFIFMFLFPILSILGVYKEFISASSVLTVSWIAVFLVSYSYHADISLDSTAFATQVMTGIKGKTDRFVRPIPYFFLTLVITFIQSCVYLYFEPNIQAVVNNLVVVLIVFLVAISVNSCLGTLILYPIQVPNSSIFEQKGTGNMGLVMLTQFAVMVSTVVLLAPPALVYGYFDSFSFEITSVNVIALAVGLVYAIVIAYIGYIVSSKLYDKNKTKYMEKIASWPDHKVKVL
ncbi:hypothetical protein HCQ94_04205 [Actinomyces sp. zg-332]|uniref:hypothetical protein n=1 Tax=Actinomyces sp. zg-332 TaxID=2708340 RepID=UPI001423376D|nr:hypothetical protein [Actinomyces sp. zg-332]QPK93799.1 hypothetical protein HCQ94_04205 [Actinomyces sp. zg-332]